MLHTPQQHPLAALHLHAAILILLLCRDRHRGFSNARTPIRVPPELLLQHVLMPDSEQPLKGNLAAIVAEANEQPEVVAVANEEVVAVDNEVAAVVVVNEQLAAAVANEQPPVAVANEAAAAVANEAAVVVVNEQPAAAVVNEVAAVVEKKDVNGYRVVCL